VTPIVAVLAKAHQGTVRLADSAGRGACFEIALPAA
jgi:signal transduction histidine kinase